MHQIDERGIADHPLVGVEEARTDPADQRIDQQGVKHLDPVVKDALRAVQNPINA